MPSPNSLFRRLIPVFILAALFLGLPALFLASRWGAFKPPPAVPKNEGLPLQPVARPAPISQQGYVGSDACKKCHAEIAASYADHPMGRSAELPPFPREIENYAPEKAEFAWRENYRYRAEKKDGKVVHRELTLDPKTGATVSDQAEEIGLAVGAGVRGRSYAVVNDGLLRQSPISWYAADGGTFNLSPGYQRRELHFNRQWLGECLHCHIGRPITSKESESRFTFPELTIGCERCHGPGEQHVRLQEAKTAPSPDTSIVNPSRLPMRERESVCYDCHLEGVYRTARYGRSENDFRPGMALEDVACILVKPLRQAGSTDVVSQVEQMWSSGCFQGSQGKMGCVSCHDPHARSAPEKRDEYYRDRCNECHAEKGCSLAPRDREREKDSCIACHMPGTATRNIAHVSQSNHRIPRSPHPLAGATDKPANEEPLQFFDNADERMPRWEALRARAMQRAVQGGLQNMPQEEVEALLQLTEVLPDDAPLFQAIGKHYLIYERFSEARHWLDKAVQANPRHEAALADLALALQAQGKSDEALPYIDRSLNLNPWIARRHGIRAEIFGVLGNRAAAAESARRAIELDPSEGTKLKRLAEFVPP